MKSILSKKVFISFVMMLVFTFMFTSCAKDEKTSGDKADSKPKVTVTTSFLNDMVNVLAKDMVDVQMIIPAGSDPHLYVAKPEDHKKIQDCDLLLYHGLHFEGKMVEALESKGIAVSKNFPQDKIGRMEENGEEIIDPHFWFDIDLYKDATKVAAESLIELLPDKKTEIMSNLESYLEEIDNAKEESMEKIAQIPKENRYLVTPHDAFNYFSRMFDIEVIAPQGVSTDSEVANKDLSKTADFIVEHKIKSIFAESTTDPARMEKLKESCKEKGFDVKVVSGEGKELFSDSLAPSGQEGDTFITMFRHNVELIYDNLK